MTNGNNTSTSNDINVADTIQCALKYAEHGFYVFPVMKNDKIPSTAHGMNDATRDPVIIQRMFTSDDNIGINCIKSGVIVIDIDNSDDKIGNTSFKEFVKNHGDDGDYIPNTSGQRSARDGIHLMFKVNDDLINACGDGLPKNLCKDVDIKYRGYIVAEPSTFRGGRYIWIRNNPLSDEFVFDVDVAELPTWMVREIIRIKYPKNGGKSEKLYNQDLFEKGNRNNGLLSEAGRLRRVIDDHDTLFAALQQINQKKCVPPVDDAELNSIVHSAMGYTPTKPITPVTENAVNEPDTQNFGIYNDNGVLKRPNYANIGEYLIKKCHCYVYGNDIYIYDPVQKIYRANQSDIESEIITICNDQIGWNNSITEPQRQIMSYIKNNTNIHCHDYPFNRPEDGISVRNGVIKIVDGKINFEESSHEHLFTYRINVVYDQNADREPIREILKTIADGDVDKINTFYEIPAQGILQMQRMTFKRAYLFSGPPHTGKSTLLDLYKKTFGYNNISEIQLQKLDDRWSAYTMENKLMNAYDDLSPLKMADTSTFKTFTGTVFHTIEQKYHDSRVGLVNPVHVFSANVPPFVPTHAYDDEGFWVRWGLVEFTHVFKKNPAFNNIMLQESNISGFFNDVLDAVVKIIKNDYVLSTKDDYAGVRDKWMYLSNDLYRFINDQTTINMDAETHEMITLEDLYTRYVAYLTSRRVGKRSSMPTIEMFGKQLANEFGMNLTQHRVTYPSGNYTRERLYYGIVWK